MCGFVFVNFFPSKISFLHFKTEIWIIKCFQNWKRMFAVKIIKPLNKNNQKFRLSTGKGVDDNTFFFFLRSYE